MDRQINEERWWRWLILSLITLIVIGCGMLAQHELHEGIYHTSSNLIQYVAGTLLIWGVLMSLYFAVLGESEKNKW